MSYYETIQETYDALKDKVISDLNDQFTAGRIRGTEYADVYAQLMQIIIQESSRAPEAVYNAENILPAQKLKIDSEIKNMETATSKVNLEMTTLVPAQEAKYRSDIAYQNKMTDKTAYELSFILPKQRDQLEASSMANNAQAALTTRQTKAFDDNVKQKALETVIGVWGVAYSAGKTETMLSIASDANVSDLYNSLINT